MHLAGPNVLFKDSQENLSDNKKSSTHSLSNNDLQYQSKQEFKEEDSSFFDVLSRIQSNRLDDQRCSIRQSSTNSENLEDDSFCNQTTPNDEFFNLIMKSQRTRLEDQRTSMNNSKKTTSGVLVESNSTNKMVNTNLKSSLKPNQQILARKSVTVPPDDEFFSMIQKIQSRRLDEQRSSIKSNPFSSILKSSKSGSEMRKKTHLV